MKKFNLPLTFLLLGFLTVFSISCERQNVEKPDYRLQEIDRIISTYNVGRLDKDWATKKEGDLRIIWGKHEITLVLNTPEDEKTHTYFLQIDTSNHDIQSSDFGLAEVVFFNDRLVVNSLERRNTLLFSLPIESSNNYTAKLNFTNTYFGPGIGYSSTNKNQITTRVPNCRCYPEGGPVQGCQNGGPNSSSCSISTTSGQCSVTCDNGYYACCNP